jgi:hypothetical protein
MGKIKESGKIKLIKIIKIDVIDNQAVNKIGAVDKYFKKSFIKNFN